MRKGFVFTIAAAAVLLSVSGAATRAAVAPHASSVRAAALPSGAVTLAVPTNPGNLDPQLTVVGAARYVGSFAYDTLVNLVGPGRIVSGLAQSWKVVSPKRVEFTLHRGITCSDGTAMTATVVKRNLDFVGNPASKSPLLGLFMPVGATVTANDRTRTVVVTTASPNPFMLQGLALVQLVCSRGLADRSLLGRGAIGTGPYRMTRAVPGDRYVFTARRGYRWGPGGATTATAALPATVTLRVITNESTAANLLLTGGINLVSLSGADRARLNRPGISRRVSIGAPLEFFFNERAGRPTASQSVRRALVQALNLAQIGTVATSGLGVRMTQLTRQDLTPCAGNSVAGAVPAFNPQAARAALSGSAPEVKLLYPTDAGASFPPAAELTQQLLTAAGVRVTLDGQSTAALTGKLFGTGDWDIVLIGIGVATPAQMTGLVSGPAPPNGSNFASIDNAAYKQSVALATRRVGAPGCRYWLDAERALFRSADIAPMSVLTTAFFGRGLTFSLGPQGPLPTSLRRTR